jgi:hypothetical protein
MGKTPLEKMKEAIDLIEQEQGEIVADFYRAHYQGCLRLHEMGERYKTLPKGDERDKLKEEMKQLEASLNESLPILKGKS